MFDSVAGLCQVGVVGHNNKGLTKLIAQGTEEALEFVGIVGVEVARGFVGKHHIGVVDKSSGYGRTLFLAAAEFRWFVLGTVAKCEEVQQFGGPFVGLGFALSANEGWHHNIFYGCELGQQLMKLKDEAYVLIAKMSQVVGAEVIDIGACNAHCSLSGFVQSAEYLQQRGLACTAGSRNGHHLGWHNVQVDAA